MTPGSALATLAAAYGVEERYVDQRGEVVTVSPDAVLAVLAALGAPVAGAGDVADAVRLRQRADAQRGLAPTIVAWDGELGAASALVPAPTPTVDVMVELEGGGTVDVAAGHAGSVSVDGTGYERLRLQAGGRLPLGYHRLAMESGSWRRTATVIAAPRQGQQPDQPLRGVFAPVYALHSEQSVGAGNLSDLVRLAAWVGRLGGTLAGTLPILAAFLDEPCEPSPYAPVSRLMWNELYLDLTVIPEVVAVEAVPLAPEQPVVDTDGLIDHRRQAALQRSVLADLARRLPLISPARQEELERFLARRPEVERYAAFRAAGERHGADWRSWPAPLSAGRLEPGDFDPAVAGYHAYVQWLTDLQVGAAISQAHDDGVALYVDVPVGVHRDGWDAWERQDLFVDGLSVGAPPDVFFTRGQDWGFAPLHPLRSSAEGHRYFRDCLAHQARLANVLRIDHVMALHRLYCIPAGAPPGEGAYVAQPAEELWATVLLESHRNRCVMVGENLGTVPPEVDDTMTRHRVAGMYVLQFDARPEREALGDPPAGWLATVNTHDMPTFAAWWTGADIDDRVDLELVGADEAAELREERRQVVAAVRALLTRTAGLRSDEAADVLAAVLRRLGSSEAAIAVVALEDLWLETRSQNTPGTTTERPNWRRQAQHDLEHVESDPHLGRLLRNLIEGSDPG